MIAATATFAVLKRQPSPATVQVVTILTGLADIRPHDATEAALPTYEETVHIATERGLAREARIGFLKQFGVAEFVSVSERIAFATSQDLDRPWRRDSLTDCRFPWLPATVLKRR